MKLRLIQFNEILNQNNDLYLAIMILICGNDIRLNKLCQDEIKMQRRNNEILNQNNDISN